MRGAPDGVIPNTATVGSMREAYAIAAGLPPDVLHRQLRALGWPPDRVALRVIRPVDAARRLANRSLAVLALSRALVVVEDPEGRLYTVRTLDLLAGRRVDPPDVEDKVLHGAGVTFGQA